MRRFEPETILIGDVNLPGINWAEGRSDTKGRELLDTVMEESLYQLVSFPTHIKGNILDLLITNCPERILDIEDVGRLGRSDHSILSIIIESQLPEQHSERERLNWNKADVEGLRGQLKSTDWSDRFREKSMEESWTQFRGVLKESIRKHVPLSRHRTKFNHPWMTGEILRMIRRKRRKWRTAKHSAQPEDLTEYKRLQKETANAIRRAKRKMEWELANTEDKNNRRFTKYIKSKTKSKTSIGPLVTKEKKLLVDEREMAVELNKFFSTVFTEEDTTSIPIVIREEINHEMPAVRVSKKDLQTKIRKLRKEAAPGPDGITPRFLQEFEMELLTPLEILLNKSLSTGEVPAEWKAANVTPIFKKGAKGDVGNYRPVSLTSIPCKLLESVVKDRMMHHLLSNKLIRDTQHGFMPGRSCATNLVQFMDLVTKAVDEGQSVDIFYLDFAKAFDKVPHKRLIKKLVGKGVEPGVVSWIESWLTDRKQKVCIQGKESEESDVKSGVPQGTVLGPILFSVFIDDLEDEVSAQQLDVFVTKFADDTKGGKVITSPEDRDKLQKALDCLCSWADKWGMTFNVSKCKILHIGRNNPEYDYYMHGVKMGTTEIERDVGVMVSKTLKPMDQCEAAAGRAMSVLGQLRRNFHYRDRNTFIKLYKQYVRPHLEFSVPAWSPWLRGDIDKLERVQEKAVGMVAGLKGKNYLEKCEELGLLTLEKRRHDQDMTLVHKLLSQGGGGLLQMAGAREGARTRQAAGPRTLAGQFARTDVRKHSFAVRVVERWNSLPDNVRVAENQEAFKRGLRAWRKKRW
jgi:hypothetical protein